MCGISGLISFKNPVSTFESNVLQSISHLSKRGPDATGSHFFSHYAAAHARLSIIDTSSAANQPFLDANQRYSLVFNGEIFNYLELKETWLSDKNISFKTHSDTEVLLHLLIHYGEKCLTELRGFWAFSFYDSLTKTCLVARDCLGKKPLWYAHQNDIFCFASEFKALNAYPIPKELDMDSVVLFFRLSYLPAPFTAFKNVHKLEPGHFLKISQDAEIEKVAYYQLPFHDQGKEIDYEQAKQDIYKIVDKSVAYRLIADVPCGSFLSGGIDSAIVSALACKQKFGFETFCLSFPDLPYLNESDFAAETARFIGSKHHTIPVSQNQMLESAEEVLSYTDDLFADSSAIAVNALCKEVSQHVKVALSGDGGDEVFGGYRKHQAMVLALKKSHLHYFVKCAASISKILPSSRSSKMGDRVRKIQKLATLMSQNNSQYYNYTLEWFHEDTVSRLLKKSYSGTDIDARINSFKPTEKVGVNSWLYTDLKLLLQGDMLPKVDLFSMFNGMEVRNPLLDLELVEYASQLPGNFKVSSSYRKKVLYESFAHILPENIANRPKKGFEVPLRKWMQEDWKEILENEWLNEDTIQSQGILNVEVIRELKEDLKKGNNPDAHFLLWNSIVFTKWFTLYSK